VRPGRKHLIELGEARFDAATLGPREAGQQATHIVAGALGAPMELAGAREAASRLERASDEFHELPVGLRTKFH
jgi:hypothetical protein